MDTRQPIRARAAALQGFPGQGWPEATPETIARADTIAGGTVFFYGRTPVEVGLRGIDWRGTHVAHQEWPAQLNRFFMLGPLAAAFAQTHDEKYAAAARAYLEDWIAQHDYTAAEAFTPGDSGLNMSIRLGTSHSAGWGGTLPAFLDSPHFDGAFLAALTDSLAPQARFLSRHLTAWGNWRISELDTLVFTALRFPFLEGAEELLRLGIQGMRNALATQFLPDGVHIERTPGYATWMAQVAASYAELARRFPEANAHVDPHLAAAALDYVAQSQLCGMNDVSVVLRDPPQLRDLNLRAALLPRLFPDRPVAPPPLDQVFPAAGQVFSRTAWEPGAQALAFDASTWGGGHGHLSRLSFSFRAGGRLLVADPGILNYEMSDPLGPHGKSTRAHTTLNVNGGNQAAVDATLHHTDFTPESALIHASYDGSYWEGEFGWNFFQGLGVGAYGRHERVLLWRKGEYLLVLDRMETDPGATVHNVWQLGPAEEWTQDAGQLAWWSRHPDTNLYLRLLSPTQGVTMEWFEGNTDPPRGWVGSHGNDATPAPLVEFRYPGRQSGAESVVLLTTFAGEDVPTCDAQLTRHGATRLLTLTTSLGADLIAWTPRLDAPVEVEGQVVSDAPFVWLRTDAAGEATAWYKLRGRYLRDHGGVLSDSASPRG